jgi:hypothetical protein
MRLVAVVWFKSSQKLKVAFPKQRNCRNLYSPVSPRPTAVMPVTLTDRVPLASISIACAPLRSLEDALRVVAALDDLGLEALVRSQGLIEACVHAAPLVRAACGLTSDHVADIGDMISRIFKSLLPADCNRSSQKTDIAIAAATKCFCGGSLSCAHAKAVMANVQGLNGSRAVLHVPRRCTSGCRNYHWYNYMVSDKHHWLRGDVADAPFFFVNARQGFDLSYLQMLRLRVCRLHATFLGEADVIHLQTKLYAAAAPPWGGGFRKLLQQAYFMWNAARSAQQMFCCDAPDSDSALTWKLYPFDIAATSESQLNVFWEKYNLYWHRKWCSEHAHHHRRRVRVNITDGLADQLLRLRDSANLHACTVAGYLHTLAGKPELAELSQICDDHEIPRATAHIEAVEEASVDVDGRVTSPALLLFMDKVEQQMFVMDGHMKCHRTRCCALRAQKIDCPGYGSDVFRGCLNTPMVHAHFCDVHTALQVELEEKYAQALLTHPDMPGAARNLFKGKVAREVAKHAAGDVADNADLTEMAAECERCVKEDNKKCSGGTTGGVLTACTTSGYFCGWEEIHDTESLSQRYSFVARLFLLCSSFTIVVHDDACHMARLFGSARRALSSSNAFFKRLLGIVWILDRWHAKNHVGEWCKKNVDPSLPFLQPFIRGHNTEICESTNAWLAGFKHAVRHMNQFSFKFHLATNMDCHNEILSAGAGAHLMVCRPVQTVE